MEKKPGRNDPCPCGSGKKYKNCHMLTESKKATHTESGKKKFRATLLQAGDQKSQALFQGVAPTPMTERKIKPISVTKFKKSETDYRVKPSEEGLPFEIRPQEKQPTEQKGSEQLPEDFKPTKEDYRQ